MANFDNSRPFECPICFEEYNEYAQTPTTLPCGHSCCLSHMRNARHCYLCRQPAPSFDKCSISYALRDGALLYQRILLRERPDIQIPSALPTEHFGKAEVVPAVPLPSQQLLPIQQYSHTHRKAEPSDKVEPVRSRATQIQEPVSLSSGKPSATIPPSPPPQDYPISTGSSRSNRGGLSRMFNFHFPWWSPISKPAHVTTLVEQNQIKSCGHVCSPSTLPRCCACMDRRPFQQENTYPVYVDGQGWQAIGSRNSGYCPPCRAHSMNGRKKVSSTRNIDVSSASSVSMAPPVPPPPMICSKTNPSQNATSGTHSGLKSCGHTCFPSSLPRCCACMDRRPIRKENTYPVYVDGQGWQEIGSRDAGYCPQCRPGSSKS